VPQPQLLRAITVLPVSNIADAAEWYRKALGIETVYLHESDNEDEPPPHEQPWTKAGTGYLYLLVRDVDAVSAEVCASGVSITRGLQTENWGARGFNLTDPSGNAIHVEQGE